jgi:2-polyprenyl-3-methyl-5-hydroxy-6-metoxy-1,4-benzoquinol methylase
MAIIQDTDGAEVAALKRLVPSFRGLRVLEVGCGDGRMTKLFASEVASLVAIDPDEQAIAECRAAFSSPKFDVRTQFFEHFAAPRGSFDVVILAWSL